MIFFEFATSMASAARGEELFGFEQFHIPENTGPEYLQHYSDFVNICAIWASYFNHPNAQRYIDLGVDLDHQASTSLRAAILDDDQYPHVIDSKGNPIPVPRPDRFDDDAEREITGMFFPQRTYPPPTSDAELYAMTWEFAQFASDNFQLYLLEGPLTQDMEASLGQSVFQLAFRP